MTDANNNPPSPPTGHSPRRGFFAQLFGEALNPVSDLLEKQFKPILHLLDDRPKPAPSAGKVVAHEPPPERFLRPPGALPEEQFASSCSRCNKCVEVCPAQCIQLDFTSINAGGLPYIVPREMPCVVCDTLACMHECPTGALRIVPREEIRMGLAVVDHDLCRRNVGEDCRHCVESCPIGEAAISIGPQSGRVRVREAGCIGCGICEQSCPTQPASITVWPPRSVDDVIIA